MTTAIAVLPALERPPEDELLDPEEDRAAAVEDDAAALVAVEEETAAAVVAATELEATEVTVTTIGAMLVPSVADSVTTEV